MANASLRSVWQGWKKKHFHTRSFRVFAIQFLAQLNPMTVIVNGYRNSLLNLTQPGGLQIAVVLAISFAVFVLGAVLFRQAKPAFADIL